MSEKDLIAAPQIKIDGEWVMEPEVPRPAGIFLQHSIRRCFMEDRVDLRVRLSGFTLSPAANIKFQVTSFALPGRPLIKAVFVGTDAGEVKQARSDFRVAEQRALKPGSFLLQIPEADSAQGIVFELDATGGAASSLVTSVIIPDLEVEKATLVFSVSIKDQGQTLGMLSSPLEVIRWYADPDLNLKFKPTQATKIQPVIDGEAFFNRVSALLQGATNRVLIATWTFWMDMFLTGEPTGPGRQLFSDLKAAAARGVKIHILVDFHNGSWVAPMLNKHLAEANITIRTATHPHQVFKVKQSGSYHEKYISVDSKTALVGGIDFHPQRYNNTRHNFKPNYIKFRDQDQARGPKFIFPKKKKNNEEIKEFSILWHDSAVEVEGPIVIDLENDFARRWDEAGHVPPFIPERPNPPPAGGHNVQLVKTDMLGGSTVPSTPSKRIPGTLNAYTQAIAGARHFIYIENQYLNFQPLGKLLEEALNRTPTLQLIIILPFDTEEAAEDETKRELEPRYGIPLTDTDIKKVKNSMYLHSLFLQRQIVDRLRKVSNATNRVGFFTLGGHVPGAAKSDQIYPHSKMMIVDDTWAIVGSANTNGRGFKIDGEMNVVIHSRPEVTAFRNALWKEHLGVELNTRQIRDYFKEWNQRALKGFTKAEDIPPASLSNLHAVVLTNPPAGQKYNGQLESIGNFFGIIDDEV